MSRRGSQRNAGGYVRHARPYKAPTLCKVCGLPNDHRHDLEACALAWIRQCDAERAKEGSRANDL